MRVMFAGTPQVALPSLTAILGSGHDLRGILTRPPAPVGRKRTLTPSPVHQAAEAAGLPVLTGAPNAQDVLGFLREERIECVAVVAYGALIKEPALSTPAHGWVNLHFSQLPQWRGAAPVQHAIMAGQTRTGACTFQIERGLDTGPVFDSLSTPIGPDETAGDVLTRLADLGAELLVSTLDAIAAGTARPAPQHGDVSYAPTLHAADARIDWTAPGEEVAAKIRGVTPAPGAWTAAGERRYKLGPVHPAPDTGASALPPGQVRVLDGRVLVGTGTHPVALDRLAPPGKAWMGAADWARGARFETLQFEARV